MRRALVQRPVVVAALLSIAGVAIADGLPWYPRRIRGMRPNHIATARVAPAEWPAEPESPAQVDPGRFAQAIEQMCDWMPPGRPLRYADWILRHARRFQQDPFLVAALMYRQTLGSCRPDWEGPYGGIGLFAIQHRMYWDGFEDGEYRYQVLEGEAWVDRRLPMDDFLFAGPRLQRAEESIYFASGLLAAWEDQHPSVDEAFDQVPHRHPVSHFIWGDRVRSDRAEDRVLTDRRRLLFYYGSIGPVAPIERLGLRFGSALDGAPRVLSSGLGDRRDGGDRNHRGVDLESLPGEPVRAIADGRVIFAGVDLPGNRHNRQLTKDEYESVPRGELGNGGRYACILHPGGEDPRLRSCYMHLELVEVEAGDEVARGDLVGTVGRTGMESSAAHLHLELHGDGRLLDPSEVLRPLIIGDPDPDVDLALP